MFEKKNTLSRTKRNIPALLAAGALSASMLALPTVAYATDNTPSVGANTGSGQTELTMVMRDAGEHGGYADDETNPDRDNDDLGDNLAFTVPSSINFVVDADGSLTGPSTGAYIENRSAFAAHVSSMKVDAQDGWNFVADANASDKTNAVDLQIGPSGNLQQASNFIAAKAGVSGGAAWNMAATSDGTSDQVALETAGDVANIAKDLTTQQKFGTIHWYVTPGAVS